MEGKYIAPAPWDLTGNGVVLLYRFPPGFVEEHGFLLDYQRKSFKASVGAVLLMDYKSSGVGSYREILFIPGMIRENEKIYFTISKIYVSTYDSVRSGQRNWGIPKELADFEVDRLPDGSCSWKVKKDGNTFFEAVVQPKGLTFPFTTTPLPLTRIFQQGRFGNLITKPDASGMAKTATLQKIYSNPEDFPPVHEISPIMTFSLEQFKMVFPVALQAR